MDDTRQADFAGGTAAFVMAHWLTDDDLAVRHLDEAVRSVVGQTDPNWVLIIVDDCSKRQATLEHLKWIGGQLGEKAQIIYSPEHIGPGQARNAGIRAAAERNAPFVLFLDDDDRADPRRLELTREAFLRVPDANVVYTAFDVIDENSEIVPPERVCSSVREIMDGLRTSAVEGEDAWIRIAAERNYVNLPSCTAVRTELALQEPFPQGTVSEDAHTWLRYAAHPGKFIFLGEIRNQYRIRSGTDSRARSMNASFYAQKAAMDSDGFEKAAEISKRFGRLDPAEEERIRARFYARLALSMLRGGDLRETAACMSKAAAVLPDTAEKAVLTLDAAEGEKETLLGMLEGRMPGTDAENPPGRGQGC